MSDRAPADGVDDGENERDGTEPAGGRGELIEGETTVIEASGRPYLLGAAGVVTLFAAAAGYVVAANNAVSSVAMFGVITVPGTPAAVAVYGAVLSVGVLAALFALVTVASRFDEDAVN